MANIYGKGPKGKATKLHSLLVRRRKRCEGLNDDGTLCEYECPCDRSDLTHGKDCKLEAAHIISRTYSFTRTLMCNSYCLCSQHHAHFTKWPREFSKYITQTWAQDIYEDMKFQARQYHKVNWDDRLAVLETYDQFSDEELRDIDYEKVKEGSLDV